MIKIINAYWSQWLQVREFRKRLQEASEALKDSPIRNFFEEQAAHFTQMAPGYVCATKYYPDTKDKDKGWAMICEHNRSNVEELLKEFNWFVIRLVTEIRINDFDTPATSEVYGILIEILQAEQARIIKRENGEC